jgi:hypothetical protein
VKTKGYLQKNRGEALRMGEWKLHIHQRGQGERAERSFELYDLDVDISESKDAADQNPEVVNFSVEANFNAASNFRITMKDIFRPGVTPDRVFTFTADRCWGFATFEARGNVEPRKLRLADRREFKVAMKDGLPVVNWEGLYEETKWEGFAQIDLALPRDGFVSLNIKNAGARSCVSC